MYMAAKTTGEKEFLEGYDPTAFARPSLTVDVVIVTVQDGRLCTLLVRRDEQPQKGCWALPGGFVGIDETLDEAAARVLATKVGLEGVYLEQLYTFGSPGRDPRTRVVTVAYMALVDRTGLAAVEAVRPETVRLADLEVPWAGETGGPVGAVGGDGANLALAFDHAEILGTAVLRLRGKLDYAAVGFELLPSEFTLRQLQDIHEAILGRQLNKDSFRRKMLARGHLIPTGRREEQVAFRPPELYRFNDDVETREKR
jgi:8-oxo-dGTP diphosphatase